MVQRESKIYNFEKIEKLLRKLDNFSDAEKWKEIGTLFDKTPSAVRRWYYRQTKKQKEIKQNQLISEPIVEQKKEVSTDMIRTVYHMLLKKGCRIGYYKAINEIIDYLKEL